MVENFDISNIEIKEANLLNYDKEDWILYHEFRKKRHMAVRPDDPYVDDEATEKSLKSQLTHPEFSADFHVIIDNSTGKLVGRYACIAIRETSPSYEGNKHFIQFDLALLDEYRRKGIGTMVLKQVYKYAKESNRTHIMSGSEEEDGKAFLKAIGAQVALSGVENRLKLKDIDWEMVEKWAKEGPERSPSSTLHFVESIPDEVIERYCEVFTETLNQQPLGDLEINDLIYTPELIRDRTARWKELGRTHMTFYTQEADGDISGLTEMIYVPEKETFISQLLTGVQKKYRGRGLGKWLKAAMLLKTREKFPEVEVVVTDNATTNDPMLSINDRLGFKPYKESITAQLSIDALEEYLKNR